MSQFSSIVFSSLFSLLFFANYVRSDLNRGVPKSEDYYTSLVGIQNLVRTEQEIVATIVEYKRRLVKRLDLINRYLNEYLTSVEPLSREGSHNYAKIKYPNLSRAIKKSKYGGQPVPHFTGQDDLDDIAEYMTSHPFLAFRLLRRLSKELPELVQNFETDIETELETFFGSLPDEIRIPDQEDVAGSANGVLRVQLSNSIPTKTFIQGHLEPGKEPLIDLMSPFDLHYVGMGAINHQMYAHGLQWLSAAYEAGLKDEKNSNVPIPHLEESLLYSVRLHNAAIIHLDEVPQGHVFKKQLAENITLLKIPKVLPLPKNFTLRLEESSWSDVWNFYALCGGKTLLAPEITKDFHCYYKRDTPYSQIAPVKVEELSKSPTILQFYNVLDDKMIAEIKLRAAPTLARARIQGSGQQSNIKSDLRTSSVTWLPEDAPHLHKISRIVKDLTGLDGHGHFSAEILQASCYGAIGGHYQPHFDFLYPPNYQDPKVPLPFSPWDRLRGDRIATMMFYLSDVELGGGTAFPRIGVAASAAKGSAIFWYNLKENGDRDNLSLHGGCPVGRGVKWVANKWMRATQQMPYRPCSLNPKL